MSYHCHDNNVKLTHGYSNVHLAWCNETSAFDLQQLHYSN